MTDRDQSIAVALGDIVHRLLKIEGEMFHVLWVQSEV